MANVFDGEPDKRQSDGKPEATLFRPRYRKLTDDKLALHDQIKAKADELAALFAKIDTTVFGVPSPEFDVVASLAGNKTGNVVLGLRHLEDAVYRAVKALTA